MAVRPEDDQNSNAYTSDEDVENPSLEENSQEADGIDANQNEGSVEPETEASPTAGAPESGRTGNNQSQQSYSRSEDGWVSRAGRWAQEKLPSWAYTIFWGTIHFIGKVIRTLVFGDERVMQEAADNFNRTMDAERRHVEKNNKEEEADSRREAAREQAREKAKEAYEEQAAQKQEEQKKDSIPDKDEHSVGDVNEPNKGEAQGGDKVSESEHEDRTDPLPEKTLSPGDERVSTTFEVNVDPKAIIDEMFAERERKLREEAQAKRSEPAIIAEQVGSRLVSDGRSDCFGGEGSGIAKFIYERKGKENVFYVPASSLEGRSTEEMSAAIKEGRDVAIAQRYLDSYNTQHHTNIQILAVGEERFILGEKDGQSISCARKDLGGNISRPVATFIRLAERGDAGQATMTDNLHPATTPAYAEGVIEQKQRESFANAINSPEGRRAFASEGLAAAANEQGDEIYILRMEQGALIHDQSWVLSRKEFERTSLEETAESCADAIDGGVPSSSASEHYMIDAILSSQNHEETEIEGVNLYEEDPDVNSQEVSIADEASPDWSDDDLSL